MLNATNASDAARVSACWCDIRGKMNCKRIFNSVGALMLCMVLMPSISMAQVFKCEDASGNIAYQGTPCATGKKESRPFILDPPSLTDEEKFNAAAYSAGMTPEEAKRLLQGGAASPEQPVAGAGQVEAERQNQQRAVDPRNAAYRCTRLNGTSYVSSRPCPKRGHVAVNGTTTSGAPAMGGFWAPMQQEVIDKDEACQEAKARRDRSKESHRKLGHVMPDEYRRSLDRNVSDVCKS